MTVPLINHASAILNNLMLSLSIKAVGKKFILIGKDKKHHFFVVLKIKDGSCHGESHSILASLRALRGAARATHPLNKIVITEKKRLPKGCCVFHFSLY